MVHAVVVDPSRFIKLTLWESFVSSVVYTNEIYLNTAQSGTAVNIKDDFQKIHVLSVAPQAPAEYLVTTQDSKITLTNSQNASDF